jgi:hypothetical protein
MPDEKKLGPNAVPGENAGIRSPEPARQNDCADQSLTLSASVVEAETVYIDRGNHVFALHRARRRFSRSSSIF